MVFEPLPIRVMLVSSVYITLPLEVCVIESIVLLKIRYNIFCKIYINKHTSILKKNAEIMTMSCTSWWQWCATCNFLSYWHTCKACLQTESYNFDILMKYLQHLMHRKLYILDLEIWLVQKKKKDYISLLSVSLYSGLHLLHIV